MPHIIACLSQKGGVGKSTLARLIAWGFAEAGWQTKIADFNTRQKTSVDWVLTRRANGLVPEVDADEFTTIKPMLKDKADMIVADGRPDSDQTSLEIARVADLVIIPTGTTIDDIKPQLLFANELRQKGVPMSKMVFMINKTTESQLATDEARGSIEGLGYEVLKTDLSAKTGYQMAQNQGKSVAETLYPSLNQRAFQLLNEIATRMETVKETA